LRWQNAEHLPMPETAAIDSLLAHALAGEVTPWPAAWQDPTDQQLLLQRVIYHGIAGLLFEQSAQLLNWPQSVLAALREQSIALTMWEMRHRIVLGELLNAFSQAGIQPLILKGSAFAYDLYATPASRARGDSDLFIAMQDVPRARELLAGLGYQLLSEQHEDLEDLNLQELWELVTPDGSSHDIDLHWQALNSLALQELFDFNQCAVHSLPLAKLHPAARGLDRPRALLHACLHRAQHISTPYHVDGVTYYGGDRLIWANDIHLLASALTPADWAQLCQIAIANGSAGVCLNGLEIAQSRLGTSLPADAMARLRTAPGQHATSYLLGGRQVRRALLDLRAIPGLQRKLRFIRLRLLPSASFLREKYPRMHNAPLLLLHLRRLLDFLRPRPKGMKH